MVEEDAGRLDVVALRRHVQSGEAVLRLGVDGRVAHEQQLDDLIVARTSCAMQWCQAILFCFFIFVNQVLLVSRKLNWQSNKDVVFTRVLASILALLSKSRLTLFALPHLVATCSGVMFCYQRSLHKCLDLF